MELPHEDDLAMIDMPLQAGARSHLQGSSLLVARLNIYQNMPSLTSLPLIHTIS